MTSPTPPHRLIVKNWQNELLAVSRPEKIKILSSFFKTGKGEYGEGDVFAGVAVPDNRAVARTHSHETIEVFAEMLQSPVHEHRLSALLAMVESYSRCKDAGRQTELIDFYETIIPRCNNWDLVDLSAPKLLGPEISSGRRLDMHERLSSSTLIWARRTAVVSTLHDVMKCRRTALATSQCRRHLDAPEPLMHKAVGWVLREVGKKEIDTLRAFLDDNVTRMTATTLSYATEKMDKDERQKWRSLRNSK
ncbi:MAG: DNA alkylation repair protein [Bacteroidales bacterium]|nr:DNA alkylation repair protein [Bacteroidales bacterium]